MQKGDIFGKLERINKFQRQENRIHNLQNKNSNLIKVPYKRDNNFIQKKQINKLQEKFYPGNYSQIINKIKKEISKIVIGQEDVIKGLLRALLSNGHVLVEGVPGIAKTLLIRVLASVTGCKFSRIQFTVDLLPTDITGITVYDENTKTFSTVKGPIFADFVIADEINRAPPKTQSALLEAMQEKQVTIGRQTYKLEEPFFVMATQNPIESSGTYPLPEAQIDRFLFKLNIVYPKKKEEKEIINTNITMHKFEDFNLQPIINAQKIIEMQEIVKNIYISDEIKEYIINLVNATREKDTYGIDLIKYIEWGSSPRASINLSLAAKAEAFLDNMDFVTPQHIKNIAFDVLRHRIIMNYEGRAEGIATEDIIREILAKVPIP